MSDLPPNSPGPQDPVPGPTPPDGTPAPAAATPEAADIEKNKIMAILAYFGIFVLIPILAAKDSPFARYHANQGLIFCIASIICAVAVVIIAIACIFVPYIGWCASCVLYVALVVGFLTLAIMGIINAASGKMKPLPVIGKFTILK